MVIQMLLPWIWHGHNLVSFIYMAKYTFMPLVWLLLISTECMDCVKRLLQCLLNSFYFSGKGLDLVEGYFFSISKITGSEVKFRYTFKNWTTNYGSLAQVSYGFCLSELLTTFLRLLSKIRVTTVIKSWGNFVVMKNALKHWAMEFCLQDKDILEKLWKKKCRV